MSIIYNTFRKDKYLRTLFTQGRYLLASENSDLELEVFDFIRNSFRNNIGNIAIGDAWKVSVYSPTQLLISPGESWYDGLPFNLSMGDDWILTLGNTPSGVTLADAPAGMGKLLTFATGTVPTGNYRVVINAVEQQINSTEDPFLQNINVPEPTASKIRLVYTVNIVTDSNQGQAPNYDTSSPVPYQGEVGSYSAVNLSNTIQINPSSTSGYLISVQDVSGSQQIDGRSVELTIANPSGVNPFPTGTTDQAQFENGTFYDANGSEYHINAIFNATTSGQVIIRLSNQVGQSDPILPGVSGSPSGFVPYYITKQDVYYTDDSTGLPTGVLHWHIAKAAFDTTNGFLHASSVTDLRDSVVSQAEFQQIVAAKFDLTLADGGAINFSNDAKFLSWSDAFTLVNPSGQPQTIPSNTVVILPGGSVVYQANLLSSTPVTLGLGNQEVNVTSSGSTLVLSGTPNFTTMSIGNAVGVNTVSDTFLPAAVNTTTDTITIPAHGFSNGSFVVFTSTGTLPTGLTANTAYYIVNTTTNTFQVVATLSGSAIAFSDQGTGTHTAYSRFSATSSITGINTATKTLQLASSITGTGPAIVFQDSFAAGTAPSNESVYTLAVYGTSEVVVGGRIQLAPSQNNVIYDERILYPSGLAALTSIVLPANSRNLYRQQYFDISNHNLEVFVNQLLKYQTTGTDTADWTWVNNSTIEFNYALPAGAEVHFRMDSLPAGSLGSSSGGGGGGNLQAAYNAGNIINVTTGTPFTVTGSSGKVAVFTGDIEVTGVIDPKGLQLDPQASNPLASGQYGIWSDTAGDLIYEGNTEVNITASLASIESGAGIARNPAGAIGETGSGLEVNVDGSTIGISGNALEVLPAGITPTQLNTDVAGAGLSGGAGSALAVQVDNSTIDINGSNNLEVKAGGITATQLSTSVTGTGLTGGAGSPLSVTSAPSNITTAVAGQAFSANTTYLVRWGIEANSETPNRVYVANAASAAANGQYLAIAVMNSSTAVSIGGTVNLTILGSYTLASGDTPFTTAQPGLPLFLKDDGSGGFTTTAPTTVGSAQYRIGVVQSLTQIWVDDKGLVAVVPEPVYDERTFFPSGLTAGTAITIPVNSRNGNVQETYSGTANLGELKIFVNELLKFQTDSANPTADWTALSSTTLSFSFNLPANAEVHFRKELVGSGVLTSGGGGGGGSQSLQSAYGFGSTITTSTGVPFTVSGPSGKIAVFNGDIEVTGVVDPTAVQLTPQSSNPLGAGQAGIWVNAAGQLTHTDGTTVTNISQVVTEVEAGTAQTTISNTYNNSTLVTIPAFSAVYTPSAGNADVADGTTTTKFQVIGVTAQAINASSTGPVAYSGYLTGVSGLTHGVYVYLGLTPGTLTSTPPTIGGGYPAGFNVVKIGIMDGTNLILQIQHIGTL